MNNAKIGTALLGGYVLGRTKKAKLAIGLGALLAGSRIKPGQVGKALQDSPFLHTLTDQVRTELTDAGKAAATTVLSAKADSLADALHERTAGLREKAQEQEQEQEREQEADDEAQDEAEDRDEDRDEGETGPDEEPRDETNGEEPREKPRPKPRKAASRRTKKTSTSRRQGQDDG
ncbi:ABC transporter substrate-binding protein [Streptomyces muensis]|uniref:ABC transporter substrate-binding protein n=1 Tax=Streptomyces muensis TaxID=1077944 RepID=A0A9X1PWK6_STRM4|nr:ABC transporter substrate-binding protein [Streptomyces muensis]MCF1594398.1 ABC transporter substrate-binding protein [Streptomyces muensis]